MSKLAPLIASLNISRHSSDHHKRNDEEIKADLEFEKFNGDDKSFYGFVPNDKISGVQSNDRGASTKRLVKQLASDGYAEAFCAHGLPNLVAALYIPQLGVFVGSIPRSKDTALKLYSMAEKFPDYSNLIRGRLGESTPENSDKPEEQLHAEDMVISNAVAKMVDNHIDPEEGLTYSKIAIYGLYSKNDHVGFKSPCGSNDRNKINHPACVIVLNRWHMKTAT
ncbi:hypothetical protein N7492_002047 [Penicillium capsulatum]|uniref:Uncharacterized protein n=1 Tax=Penicillium capsulatum TaxID=69766 RepID=A0A9W9LVZ6_9EURO|nr:hypothetical protein N7492_002047 [Penicillium capsulatum]